MPNSMSYSAFAGLRRIAQGPLAEVASAAHERAALE